MIINGFPCFLRMKVSTPSIPQPTVPNESSLPSVSKCVREQVSVKPYPSRRSPICSLNQWTADLLNGAPPESIRTWLPNRLRRPDIDSSTTGFVRRTQRSDRMDRDEMIWMNSSIFSVV
jgi:hypothetical protein